MNQVYTKLQNCYECVRKQTDFVPKVAIVLGSGLGDYAEQIRVVTEIPYAKIEDSPSPPYRDMPVNLSLVISMRSQWYV